MAATLNNTCHYSDCLKTFISLEDLIIHIENEHIDFDPITVKLLEEERPDCIPMSYVLRFGLPGEVAHETEAVINVPEEGLVLDKTIDDINDNNNYTDTRLKAEDLIQFVGCYNKVLSRPSRVCVMDPPKPFVCNIPGCEKRYKNINGIKYHYTNHHNKAPPSFRGNQTKPKSTKRKSAQKIKKEANTEHFLIRNVAHMSRLEEVGGPAMDFYTYGMPTSSEQVPLANSSFNYFNVVGMEDAHSSDRCDFYQSSDYHRFAK